jgi:hypothetical protein
MTNKLFELMKLLDEKHLTFTIRRPTNYELVLTVIDVGKRIEISYDENDVVDVCVFHGDESVEIGMDAVLQALEADDEDE